MSSPFERKAIRDSIKSCTACELHTRCQSPVPFSGPSNPTLVVVGEAPGKQEDEQNAPFVGPSGELVRSWLQDAGWNVADEVAFVNAVSCFPNRTPTKDEVEACHGNLERQLSHLQCERLLVLGGIPLGALLNGDVRVGETRGLCWRPKIGKGWALGTWHPAAVLRNRQLEWEATDDIGFFTSLIRHDFDPMSYRGQFCVKCGDPTVDYRDDIPYCSKHRPKD